MKIHDGVKVLLENKTYLKFIQGFEKYISEYAFTLYTIGKYERVYLIEDYAIEFIYVSNDSSGGVILEEIFNTSEADLNIKKFLQKDWYLVQYLPFYGDLGESNPFIRSRFEYVNQNLPQLNIQERYDRWNGKSVPYLVFELTENQKTGYAICRTSAKQTSKKVLDIGSKLLDACTVAKYFSVNTGDEYISASSGNYHFILDKTFQQIMLDRLTSKSDISWRKKNLGGGKLGLEEKGMTFFWINAYIKKSQEYFDGTVIKDLINGRYIDIDKYEYVIPENRWKSEQLVYELVKQLYPKYSVYYQYRPEYLKTENGQLSYDVFIAKKHVAIEYQGKQHFEPVEIFGGIEAFEKQKKRDELKKKLSMQNSVKLVYINYWEDITSELLIERIEN